MSGPHTDPIRLTADYHDGRSEHAQPVVVWIERGMLELAGHGVLRQVPIHQLQWPEPATEGARILVLPGGGTLRSQDPANWDAWQRQQSTTSTCSPVLRQSWRWSLAATLLLLTLCAASYVFALPTAHSG